MYCRGAGVRRLSIHPLTQVSQKPLHGSRPNFVESYLSTISPDFFFIFSQFLILKFFTIIFRFPYHGTLWEPKFQNTTSPTVSLRFQPNFMINMIVIGEYRLLLFFFFLAICQKLKIVWYFEIFVNTGPYGAGNFKTLLLQFSSDVSQTL